MRAQEEERRRLARDLHDEVNQSLTAILLRLEALAQANPGVNMGEVTELKRLVNQAMEELLTLARQLRPTALDDHGLMPAIETQLKRFAARTGVEVKIESQGDANTLPEDVQTAVYRILQEALANVGRHAAATAVSVEIDAGDGHLEMRVRDDGAGFDPGALARRTNGDGPGAGLGLSGMAERARLAGGELDVRSAPGGGTTVTFRIAELAQVAS
jgi:two-component system sensor histidine kinase UhpB